MCHVARLELKQYLFKYFNDYSLVTPGTEIKNKDGDIIQIPAGEFIQLQNHLTTELTKISTDAHLNQLPALLVEKAELMEFTKNTDQLLDSLFSELDQLPELTGKIFKHEIAYILGIIFMNMSSINVLGYHVGSANTAFARFRMLGAYCLAKAICLNNDKWTPGEKEAISREIKQAMLTDDCSGQIVGRLHGEFRLGTMNNINSKVNTILKAKLVSTA